MPTYRFPAPAPRGGKDKNRDPDAPAPAKSKNNLEIQPDTTRSPRSGQDAERGRRNKRNNPEKKDFSRNPSLRPQKNKPDAPEDRRGKATLAPVEPDAALQPGLKPVLELLTDDPAKIDAVFLRKGKKGQETSRIIDLCRENGVRFSLVDDTFLDRLWPGRHQGVIARIFATGFRDVPELLALAQEAPLPLILALDQVQDPGNAGTLARTLYALGGAGLLVPRHNGVYLGAAAARVSAGALDKLPVAKAANLAQALDQALDMGFTVYGADSATAASGMTRENVFSFTPRVPAVLVLGGEDGGLRPVIRKRCSSFICIPFAREFDSLNVAQAGAIIISAFAAASPRVV